MPQFQGIFLEEINSHHPELHNFHRSLASPVNGAATKRASGDHSLGQPLAARKPTDPEVQADGKLHFSRDLYFTGYSLKREDCGSESGVCESSLQT